jgi:hypothetical protein
VLECWEGSRSCSIPLYIKFIGAYLDKNEFWRYVHPNEEQKEYGNDLVYDLDRSKENEWEKLEIRWRIPQVTCLESPCWKTFQSWNQS